MLIYNSKKEFVGIEEHDLNALGFSDFSKLIDQAADFADLFVKTPGYVHNFKHVSWIDFIACADPDEAQRAIIHVDSKSFKCNLDVKIAYLSDEPSSKSFLVYLNNLRELTNNESENISSDIVSKPESHAAASASKSPEVPPSVVLDQEDDIEQEKEIIDEPSLEIIDEPKTDFHEEDSFDEPIDETPVDLELPLDLDFNDDSEEIEPALEPKEKPEVQTKEVEYNETEIYDNGYIYNPQIASDELGLPVDLIEEFIEDFVAQAKEFKDELYNSLNNGDNDNVKILSHKLKGVAANLRIEDAFEALAIINTSSDNTEIETNLDTFYKIISKLSGEKIVVKRSKIVEVFEEVTEDSSSESNPNTEVDELEDEIKLDFKVDEPIEEVIQEAKEEVAENIDDEIELDFKVDEPIEEVIQEVQEEIIENEHELDFKIDEPTDKEISDSEVPTKIDMPELADDEFLNQADEQKVEIDDTLDIETISDEETQSLENEVVETEDIEFLDEYKIDDEEILDIAKLETEPKTVAYDKNTIANEIGIPYDSFLDLFNDYISEAQDLLNSISDAIEVNDSKVWQNKATQLRGMSDNMRIHEFTKELETLIETKDANIAKVSSNEIAEFITAISKIKG